MPKASCTAPNEIMASQTTIDSESTNCFVALMRQWHTEEIEKSPPRLCTRDLENPEDYYQRLIEWISRQG
jgi:hypothetical protein